MNEHSVEAQFAIRVDYIEKLHSDPTYVGVLYGWKLERFDSLGNGWQHIDSLYYPVHRFFENGTDTVAITYTATEEQYIHGRLTLIIEPTTDNTSWGFSYKYSDSPFVSYYYVIQPTMYRGELYEVEA